MKRECEISEADFEALLNACKPVRYMVIGGVPPSSPQENANSAWRSLGLKMGFKWGTVEPFVGKDQRFIIAEPIEPEAVPA